MSTTVPWRRKRPVPLAAVTCLAIMALIGAIAQPVVAAELAATPVAAVVPELNWVPCRDGFECAKARVPLDHDVPDGETISLSVIRMPAGDPSRRIGSLFLNPGGPGGSGVDIARGLAPFLPVELRGRFDIVGFDPRGILRSTPVRCYQTFDEVFEHLPFFAYPVTRRQEDQMEKADRHLGKACRRHAGPILAHMSTADVARDMDLLRQAVGDASLNYLGYSYGSMLGQTYANLFPDKARALVIDGVIDPEAWAGAGSVGDRVPVGARLRSGEGARLTHREFFRLCDEAGPQCRFSGDSRKRFNRLARKLQNNPRFASRVGLPYSDFIAISLGALYAPFIWPSLAAFYRDVEREASPARVAARVATIRVELGLAAPQENYPNFIEGFPGVICSDGNNPRDYRQYRRWADRAQEQQGHFGRIWNWAGSACAFWPKRAGRDQHLGPWNAATPNPVLVVGNLYDPATPYTGAQAAANLLPNSRLLTYAGWGHTAFFTGNFCVDDAVTRYLVTTAAPAEGTVCQPAGSPFGRLQARRGAQSPEFAAALAGTLPLPVRRAVTP